MLSSSSRLTCFFLLLIVFTASENLFGQDTLNILFVRGADRSGGATEGSGVSDPFNIRGFTEQLADIRDPAGPVFTNNPTGNGNHSWFELASLLNNNGFNVEQTTETVEAGQGRIVGHFDRNTFFNQNGAGSDVRNFDNTQLALNIFSFAATVESSVLLGDVNLDGVVDFLDISPFILALSTGSVQAEADIDQNSVVDFLDIGPFILILSDQ